MRTKAGKFFEAKIKYTKVLEDGLAKVVTELYAVEAMSFTECEARITEEMQPYMSGEWAVVGEQPASYKEVFLTDDAKADRYYKAKLQFITIDERTAKEKKQSCYYLVQAESLEAARKAVDEVMSTSMADYEVASIAESKVLDVYEYNND